MKLLQTITFAILISMAATSNAANKPANVDALFSKLMPLLNEEKVKQALPVFAQIEKLEPTLSEPLPEGFQFLYISTLDKAGDKAKTLVRCKAFMKKYGEASQYASQVTEIINRLEPKPSNPAEKTVQAKAEGNAVVGTPEVKANAVNPKDAKLDAIKAAVQKTSPKFNVDSVSKTPFDGLYEVFIGGQIVYTDENVNWIIGDGRLVDTKMRKDLTAARMEDLTKIDFWSLPLSQAIKVVRGDGSRKLAVFSDPDCPFCKKLEKETLQQMTDVTIYTFFYPIESLHPDAANKSRTIWCASNRVQAWNDWIVNEQLPESGTNCETPLEKNAALAKKLGITSTPTLFFGNGKRMLGAQPANEIEKALGASLKK